MNSVYAHSPHDDSDYIGEATIIIRGTEIPAQIELKGYVEPIDGIYRWIGRVAPNDELTDIVGEQQRTKARIRTPHGTRDGFVGDPDPWNRYRITGKSTPPFHVPTDLSELETGTGGDK